MCNQEDKENSGYDNVFNFFFANISLQSRINFQKVL
ncbi:unnamed protein product, partial [Tenebrio molitor]